MSAPGAEHLVQIGMRAVIRDVQEWVDDNRQRFGDDTIPAPQLNAYLLACLITADGWQDPDEWGYADGQS